jgi:hypothetical protein
LNEASSKASKTTAFHCGKKKRKRGALDEKTRSFSSSRPRHLTMHAKKYQNTEESARERRDTRGFGCDADSRHALLIDAHQRARFLTMFLSEGAPTFWRMLATTRNGKNCCAFSD